MTIKKFLLFLLLVSLPFKAQAESTYDRVLETGTIRCAYASWPPFLIKDPNTGDLSGTGYKYIEALGKALGLDIQWTEEAGYGEFATGLETERFDLMCSPIWPAAARFKTLLVTDPFLFTGVYAVVREEDTRFDGNLELINDEKIKLPVLDGDVTEDIVSSYFPKAQTLTLPQTVDVSHLIESLLSRKVDVVFLDKGLVNDFIKLHGQKLRFVSDVPPVQVFPEVFAMKKGEVEFKMLLDSGINILTNNRVTEKLLKENPSSSSFAPRLDYLPD